MISVHASVKPMSVPQINTFDNAKCVNASLFIFLLFFLQLISYALFVSVMYVFFIYIVLLTIPVAMYVYSYWVIRLGSNILILNFHKIAKRNDLSTESPLSYISKYPSSIPCRKSYAFWMDGRAQKRSLHDHRFKIDCDKLKTIYNNIISACSYILEILFWD